MGLERNGDVGTDGRDQIGAEGEVRHEMTVHHIPLDAIDARLLQSDAGVTQTREVSGQHGGDDRDWARHDIGSYRAPAFGTARMS